MERIRDVPPPTGLRRLAYRLPIAIYRIGLGWTLGSRFLLLEHRGRRSGALRQTVLEVVRADFDRGCWFVVAAWGDRAQWLRNLRESPEVRIETGGRSFASVAEEVPLEEAEEVIVGYGRRHPRALRSVARLVGWKVEPIEADLRALASVVRVVRLTAVETDA